MVDTASECTSPSCKQKRSDTTSEFTSRWRKKPRDKGSVRCLPWCGAYVDVLISALLSVNLIFLCLLFSSFHHSIRLLRVFPSLAHSPQPDTCGHLTYFWPSGLWRTSRKLIIYWSSGTLFEHWAFIDFRSRVQLQRNWKRKTLEEHEVHCVAQHDGGK